MTNTTSKPAQSVAGANPAQPATELVKALAGALQQAVSAQANTAWTSRILPPAQVDSGEGGAASTVALRLNGALEGEFLLSLQTGASADLLAALSSASSEDPAQAWLTLCSAAGEILLGSPQSPFESLAIETCQPAQLQAGSERLAQLELTTPQGTPGARILMSADGELFKSLANLQADARGHASVPQEPEDNPSTQIERVIDVPLAVTLRFGQRHLTLREVLALSTGSLVELDRQVEEPVDLVLGDRLIARGEVVIVDGNYGLRVTEVVQGAANRIRRAQAATAGEAAQDPGKATA